MIQAQALIDKFRYALDNRWGYIWGAYGEKWTEAKQKQKINYMVSNFGENWKNNADAKDNKYYSSALYGDKWIGHNVADCSGLFYWAFKQLGGSIYHGSNTIYDKYCSSKGKLSSGKRTDGKTLLPGTAVFTGTDQKKPHIGLYAGSGKVIEAAGTQAGVCTSNVNATKWKYWGELKDVVYSASEPSNTPSGGSGEQIPIPTLPTLKRGSKGDSVVALQKKLQSLGYDLGPCGVDGDFGKATQAAVKAFQKDHGLKVDGIVGKDTYAALDQPAVMEYYSVIVSHLSESQAKALAAMYDHAEIEKEVG